MELRQNNLDFLRLFAAVLVLFGHAFPLTGQPGPGFAANGVQTIGVKIFFLLSGYLVAKSWMADPNLLRFATRRALRILPALLVVVLITCFILGPLVTRLPIDEYVSHTTTWGYLNNARFYINYSLPGVFENNVYPNAVNGSLWSLPVEVLMYCLTPMVLVVYSLLPKSIRNVAFVIGTISVCAFAVTRLKGPVQPEPIIFYATNLWQGLEVGVYFVIGSCYCVLRLDRHLDVGVGLIALFTLAVVPLPPALQEYALYLVLPYVCLSLGLAYSPAFKRITRFGDLSYGLFLFGFPVQQSVVYLIGAKGGPWLNFLSATLISAVLAWACWHLVEKRALALKPRARSLAPPPEVRASSDQTGSV